MNSIVKDIRYGLRALLKRPGTSALAILALGLGIGLTTTMFSIVEGAFLRGLPFDRSDRILYVGRLSASQAAGRPGNMPMDDFLDWRERQHSFESLAAFQNTQAVVSAGMAPERYRAARLTPNALRTLRVSPVQGRDFIEADAAAGAPAVALISYQVWTNQFQQDPKAVGRSVRINGNPTEIIGVLPPKFGFPQTQDLWLPLEIKRPVKRGDGGYVDVFARLKDDSSVERATLEMKGIASQLEQMYPENKGFTAEAQVFVRRFIGVQVINTLLAMLGAVFGVMLIACANVTTLQLARAAERTKEVAVRAALGASRSRIIRQLLLEGLMLSSAGALLGIGLAAAGTTLFMRAIVDTNPPFWIDVRIDTTVLGFVTLITVVAALVSSLIPALRATRYDLQSVLKDEGRGTTGLRMGHFTRWLVIGEILLSCCLLVVSGLMIKTVVIVGNIQYPFSTEDVYAGSLTIDGNKYAKDEDVLRLVTQLEEKLTAEPGVRRLALASSVPQPGNGPRLTLEGQTYAKDSDHPNVLRVVASTGYFDVLRVKTLRGRLFGAGDVLGSTPVAVVGEDFARKFYPQGDAIGRRIKLGTDKNPPWLTIVGVVPSLAVAPTTGDVTESVYVPLAQFPTRGLSVLAWTAGDPLAMTNGLRTAVTAVDPEMALFNSSSVAASFKQRSWPFRVFGSLFMSFGVAALVLASAGLYGVMSFSVRRRTQEIGLRMALGADRPGILRMVVWQGMWRVLVGVTLGLVPAYFLGGQMSQLLFQVQPTDPIVIASTVTVLLASGLVASAVPAFRAASVDPLVALRHD